jgi:hypothetical protein
MSKPMVDQTNANPILTMDDFTPLSEMTQEEKTDEIVTTLREVKVALAALQNLGPAGLIKMVMSK